MATIVAASAKHRTKRNSAHLNPTLSWRKANARNNPLKAAPKFHDSPKRTSTGYVMRSAADQLRFSDSPPDSPDEPKARKTISYRQESELIGGRQHTASQVMMTPSATRTDEDGTESEAAAAEPSIFEDNEPLHRKVDAGGSNVKHSTSLGSHARRRMSTGRFVALGALLRQASVRNLHHLRAKRKLEHAEPGLDPDGDGETARPNAPTRARTQSVFKALKLRSSITRSRTQNRAVRRDEADSFSGCKKCRLLLEKKVVGTSWFANMITALVFMNALVMMFDIDFCWYKLKFNQIRNGDVDPYYVTQWKLECDSSDPSENIFIIIDWIFSFIFTIEILLTAIALGPRFGRDKWHIFDTVLVVVADIELVFGFWTTFGNLAEDKSRTDIIVLLQILSVLKLLRVLRIFRLVVVLDELRLLMNAFGRSLRSISLIILTSGLLFYIFGIFAVRSFGCKTFSLDMLEANGQDITNIVDRSQAPLGCQPHGKEYREWFGTITRAMYSLFQIMTLESWSMGIVRVVMETWWYSAFFFIFFIGISSFIILNLLASEFVSKLLEVKEESKDKERQQKSNLQKIFQKKLEIFFDKMDKDGDDKISLHEMQCGVQELPAFKRLLIETGWINDDLDSVRHMFDIMDVNDTGYVCFEEFIQLADVFGQEILKEHVYKAHSYFVRKLKKLEVVIAAMRDTTLPMIPNTKREVEMVRRTVKQLLKGCDSALLEKISLSSPIERVQSDAQAALSAYESNGDDSSQELKRSKLVQIISDYAQRTVLWWTDDEPAPTD